MFKKTFRIKFFTVYIWLFIFLLSGCKANSIKLVNPELKVSNIVVKTNSGELINDLYFRFDFSTSSPLIDLADGTTSLIQTRVKLIRDEEEVIYSIARGPYSISKDKLTIKEGISGNRYSALFFKALEVHSSETGRSSSIFDLNYDYLEIQVVYPRMSMGPKFISDVAVFNKKQVLSILSKKRNSITLEK